MLRFIEKEFTYPGWEKSSIYNKIYASDLHNTKVKSIDTKREIFRTFKETMLSYALPKYMSYRVMLYQGVIV